MRRGGAFHPPATRRRRNPGLIVMARQIRKPGDTSKPESPRPEKLRPAHPDFPPEVRRAMLRKLVSKLGKPGGRKQI